MINNTEEKDEEFIQKASTSASFLISRHIQEKIGKKINKGNEYMKISKKKGRSNQEEMKGWTEKMT
jgi:hypothetical protein